MGRRPLRDQALLVQCAECEVLCVRRVSISGVSRDRGWPAGPPSIHPVPPVRANLGVEQQFERGSGMVRRPERRGKEGLSRSAFKSLVRNQVCTPYCQLLPRPHP